MPYGELKADVLKQSNGSQVDLTQITSNEATTSTKGYMSAADKTKLDGLGSGNPVGTVLTVAMSTPPTGYLACDGSEVDRTTYADLFAAIGTTYGIGDGSSTFALPDLRGTFVRGWADGGSTDSGRVFGSSQQDATGTNGLSVTDSGHTHSITDPGHVHSVKQGGAATAGNYQFTTSALEVKQAGNNYSGAIASATTGITVNSDSANLTINSSDNETRPVNIALLYCIKF